jgi:hypothetical protein
MYSIEYFEDAVKRDVDYRPSFFARDAFFARLASFA